VDVTDLSHWAKFEPERRLVREFDHWLVVTRARQVTLGSSVFLAKRPIASMAEATAEELAELGQVTAWFEATTRRVFGAEKFNYVAAMMKDPYLHFHAFPRYSVAQERFGIVWKDSEWPRVVRFDVLAAEADPGDELIALLRDA
jgi:diadenosine tetraphosphate (Ap4A) HIT family hydrolase